MPDWLTNLLGDIDIGQAIIIVLVGVAALYFIVRKLWPGLKAAVNLSEMLGKLPGFMDRTDEAIGTMQQQIENDHKTNLRDELTTTMESSQRTEQSVEGLHGRLDVLEASVAQLTKSDEKQWAEIEKTRPPKPRARQRNGETK